MKGRPRKYSAEIEQRFEAEAERRARKLPESQRVCTKILADMSGLSIGWVAQIISRKRREIERNYLNSGNCAAVSVEPQSGKVASVSG